MSLENLTPTERNQWFRLGQSVRRGVRKEAAMYSYNGVVLPKLPESELPYAMIARHISYENLYFVDFLSLRPSNNGTHILARPTETNSLRYARYRYDDGFGQGWELVDSGTMEYNVLNAIHVCSVGYDLEVWSNFDVLNEDGSVYFNASEPIPVYE